MLSDITLPSFGSSIGEATIVQWLVAPGDPVEAGQVIAEVETDKAMAELEAPWSGVIESILIDAGSEGVEVGSALATMETEDEGATPSGATTPETVEPATPAETPPGASPSAQQDRADMPRADRPLASPYARKLATGRAIDLSEISGSGPGGRVVSRDLEGLADSDGSSVMDQLGHSRDSYELLPLSRMRRAIAEGLVRSVRDIPGFSLVVDLEFDAVMAHRKAARASGEAGPASLNDYVVRACALALRDVPDANRSWTAEGIAAHRRVNIAVAVALDDGLVTPVIRDADTLALPELARATRDAISRAQERSLKTTDLQGATFTVSNLGMLGVRAFNSILSEPQACILSVGAVEPRPVVRDGEVVIAHMASVTLTCDHRVVDGAVGARFLNRLAVRLNELED